jgi:hypothetical protein
MFALAVALLQTATMRDSVRVWRADSIAYVQLREPGHVLLLSVDPIGRITVLFPFGPYDSNDVDDDVPFAVPLPPQAQGNPATILAVRSRWAFDFTSLRAGGSWNYEESLLLQPTGGDPVAALLDISDRVTDGRPYEYGVVAYARNGAVATRTAPIIPQVCLSCVRQGIAVAAASAAAPTNAVDCSNASLTNAFCGVNSGSVSIASSPAPAAAPQVVYEPAPQVVYVPYLVPIGRGFRSRFAQPMPPPAPHSIGVAYPIPPRLVVPSPSQIGLFSGRHR